MSEIDLENVIRYIVKEKNGKRDVLIGKFDENLVNKLGLLGYISNGTAREGKDSYVRTWGMTDKASNYFRLIASEVNDREKEIGRYIYSKGY